MGKIIHGNWINGGKGIERKEFIAWERMQDRCRNKNYHSYHRYGGRGISVCERWRGKDGFLRFLKDVGKAPSPKHTLDRYPDKNGNYEPGNVRWATPKEQAENRTNAIRIEYMGKSLTVPDFAKTVGLPENVIRGRFLMGWPMDKILSTPVHQRKPRRRIVIL